MIGLSDRISATFSEWEVRARGYELWPEPVRPAPRFVPYFAFERAENVPDDGVRQTLVSSLIRRVTKRALPSAPPIEPVEKAPPRAFARERVVELQAYLPDSSKVSPDAYVRFFTALAVCTEPVAFEIVATGERIIVQFAVSERDEALVSEQLRSFFPEVEFSAVRGFLDGAWHGEDAERAVVDFGLGKEFMIPLAACKGDPFVGIVGALSELQPSEAAVYQVIFEPVSRGWSETIIQSVTHADGRPRFVNAPELLSGAREKVSHRLYAAVIRLGVRAADADRAWDIACNIGAAMGAYGSPMGNELVPLRNDGYALEEHAGDILLRQTRRSGLVLNAEELAGFVHLPSADVRAPRLRRSSGRSKRAPGMVHQESGLRLGANDHAGIATPVFLSRDARTRHMHIIGASGMGKSTLLLNLIRQDIENGEGVSVLDPHGDLIDRVLGMIPEHRVGDVLILDPSDEEYVVPFNMLSARTDAERNLLASDLVAVFRRLSAAWGDQLGSVLHNALLAFLESERGGTLHDVRRFLIEPGYRTEFLNTVRDPDVVYYWRKAFPMLTGNKSVGPIVTRLDTFLSPKSIRYMVSHGENRVDFRDIMDSGKIFLAKLSQGAIGPDNSFLLGSLIVAKIQAEAMSRQRQEESARRYHFLYADEFHEFLTPSLAQCLSGVRKYRLGLVLAHQEMQQVERNSDVASALLNAYTRVAFRVGDRDARALENGFTSFTASDLQNLSTGQAICRVERAEWDFNLSVDAPQVLEPTASDLMRRHVIEASRARFAIPRQSVEELLRQSATEAMTDRSEPRSVPAPTVEPKVSRSGPNTPAPEPVPEPAPLLHTPAQPSTPALAEQGKGGAQHAAIQARIKAEAESLGYRVVLERQVLDGLGQVDVVLSKEAVEIACEVSVENTIDYEVGNVSKCWKAGFRTIAVVCPSDTKLAKLKAAVTNSLGGEVAFRTRYYTPGAFLEWLRIQKMPTPETPATAKTHGGRVVRRKTTVMTPDEAKKREAEALELMTKMMQQKQAAG